VIDWLASLRQRLQALQSETDGVVRVTVAAVRGSAPREPGACMLIGGDWADGTIGGGHLELMATQIARDMLRVPPPVAGRLDRFPLGAALGQCCGGIVELWFERYSKDELVVVELALDSRRGDEPLLLATTLSRQAATRHRLLKAGSPDAAPATSLLGAKPQSRALLVRAKDRASEDMLYERVDLDLQALWLFGAGHVGAALARLLVELPFDLTWIDSREQAFPTLAAGNVHCLPSDDPAAEVRNAPAGALFLVLTHSHDLDYEICRALLDKRDFAWAGLIGSRTKAARFVQRLRGRGYAASEIARITCPIGLDGIDNKLPAAIAVAVAAQVLQVVEARQRLAANSEIEIPAMKLTGPTT
jgi:xanthine dehydrogenase accessory factor